MKFEFDIEVPPVRTNQTRVEVVCGESKIILFQVGADFRKPRLSGGGDGDWLPEYDWRELYVTEDRDRRDFALNYNAMWRLAMLEVKRREAKRLISLASKEINKGLMIVS